MSTKTNITIKCPLCDTVITIPVRIAELEFSANGRVLVEFGTQEKRHACQGTPPTGALAA